MPLPEEKYTSFSDLELLNLYRTQQDPHIIGLLFKRHTIMALAVANKYMQFKEDAQDIVMKVFEQLIQDLHKHEISNFRSWLYSVIKNDCLMKLRKEKNIRMVRDEKGKNVFSFMENENYLHQEDIVHKEMNLVRLEEALNVLIVEQRICVELFYLKHKSYAEIVTITGYSLNNVKSYIQNGKRNLKLKMQSLNE